MRNKLCGGLVVFLFAVPVVALGQSGSIKEFAVKAIEADGVAVNGTLSDQVSTYFQSQTKSMQPVMVEAKMVKHFSTRGCGRVQFKIRQDVMVNGKAQSVFLPVEMNYCKDGTVPFDTTEVKGELK